MIEAGTNGEAGVIMAAIRGVSFLRKQGVGPTRDGWYEALVSVGDWKAEPERWRVLLSSEWPEGVEKPEGLVFLGLIGGVLFFARKDLS